METPSCTLRYPTPHPPLLKCMANLEEGGTLNGLIDLWEEDAFPIEHLFYFLEQLHQAKLLSYTVQANGKKWATLNPFSRFVWKTFSLSTIQLSRFSLLRVEGGKFLLESPLAWATLEILDPACLEILYKIKESTSFSEIEKKAHPFLELLAGGGFLEETAPEQQIWEFHDLLFHSRSRLGRQNGLYGGTFRFEGKIPPYPAEKSEDSASRIPLVQKMESPNPPFYEVLKSRRSIRQFGKEPLSLEQLSAFLYESAAVRQIRKEGKYETVFRNAPSGGACHPIEIYLLVMQCKGLEPGLYRYHRVEHALSLQAPYSSAFDPLIAFPEKMLTQGSKVQVLLIFSARFGRTLWKYQSMGYATILKDVGALMQTMYLVATAMGLAPCANGGGHSDLFAEISGLDYLVEGSVGEFIIGTK